jgi:hypothetical protein
MKYYCRVVIVLLRQVLYIQDQRRQLQVTRRPHVMHHN